MDEKTRNKALNLSILDGALSAIMGSLAGGIFLVGFALKVLEATPQQIGILAALPMFANLLQIVGSIIIEKTGSRKKFCFLCVFFSRLFWFVIILLPFAIFPTISDYKIWVLVIVIALSSFFASLSGVAWLSWMSDLVPAEKRGTYFGKRNMISSFCGMIVIIFGGKFLTLWQNRFSETNPYGFIIIFSIGLIAGIIAAWFLSQIPDVKDKKNKEQTVSFSLFLKPLKDKNFLSLIIFASFWIFAIQIAGPFYGVFMIENLNMDFSTITVFATFATLATLFMMKIWGPISDKLGNKPIITLSTGVLVVVPFIWILALPGFYYFPVLIAHILSGAFTAGIFLSQFNIMIKLSPEKGKSMYLALFAAITGLAGAIAPIVGSIISKLFENINYTFFTYPITNLHFLFIVSAILQLITIFFIIKVKEPAASTPVAVVMQLKNDLNPQNGIASTTDFVMVGLTKGKGIVEKIDEFTDKVAEASEKKIEEVLDKGKRIIEKPSKKLKDFFNEE